MNYKLPYRRALALAGLLCLGGCTTGDVAMLATISGGAKVRVQFNSQGVAWTNEGGVRINAATLLPKPEKKLTYAFEFTELQKRTVRSVRVEDVSDEAPIVLVDSADPKLSATGQWHGESEAIDPTDPRMAWLITLPNSLRVYRFTLTFGDGKTLVLMQGAMFIQPMKAAIRQAYGLK